MPTLSTDELVRLEMDDINQGTSPLLAELFRLLEVLPGVSYERKELELLNRVPKKLGCYYLVFRLDWLWGSEGMQAVALDKDLEANARLLECTIEAFEFFGATAAAALLRDIVSVAVQAAREADALAQRHTSRAEEFKPIWTRLNACDSRFDDIFTDVYSAILADIHRHPKDWQTNDG